MGVRDVQRVGRDDGQGRRLRRPLALIAGGAVASLPLSASAFAAPTCACGGGGGVDQTPPEAESAPTIRDVAPDGGPALEPPPPSPPSRPPSSLPRTPDAAEAWLEDAEADEPEPESAPTIRDVAPNGGPALEPPPVPDQPSPDPPPPPDQPPPPDPPSPLPRTPDAAEAWLDDAEADEPEPPSSPPSTPDPPPPPPPADVPVPRDSTDTPVADTSPTPPAGDEPAPEAARPRPQVFGVDAELYHHLPPEDQGAIREDYERSHPPQPPAPPAPSLPVTPEAAERWLEPSPPDALGPPPAVAPVLPPQPYPPFDLAPPRTEPRDLEPPRPTGQDFADYYTDMLGGMTADAAERFLECGRVSGGDLAISGLEHTLGNPPPGWEPDFGSDYEPPDIGLHAMGPCDHDPQERRRPNPMPWPWGDVDPHDVGAAVEVANGRGFPLLVIESLPGFPGGGGDDHDDPFDWDDGGEDPLGRPFGND
jgi:hypothetical protein